MPNVQQKALSARRRRWRDSGMARVEVQVPSADAGLLRNLAIILRGKSAAADAVRNQLRSTIAVPSAASTFDIFDSDLPDAYFDGVFDQGRQRGAVGERWLRDEVIPVYDAMQADPGGGIPAEQLKAALHARHADRRNKAGRDS
jgi:hypothetical protein